MSLQLAAQHLSSHGRGKDSTLVHMSPREVKSLNDIAMAHGGQLSINPNTGLPEAGFLEAILPMAAGFALGPAGFGLTAMQAGLAGGALGYAMTGSLEKGLMAGLGAYGGAGIGEGFASATVDAAPGIAEAQNLARTEQMALADKFYDPASGLRPGFAEADYLSQSQNLTKGQMDAMATARTGAEGAYKDLGFMDKMGKNFETLTSPGGASGIFDKISGSPMSLLKTAGSALAPAAGELMKPKEQEEEKADADMGQRYGFSMNPTGGQPRQVQPGQNPLDNPQTPTTTPFPQPDPYGREQRYFAPSYSKLTPEEAKKMYGYADGGITGSGNLNLDIPLNLSSSGGSGGGSYGGGGNSGGTYPFQSSGGFAGYNNAPQGAQQAQQPVQQTQQVQQPAQENQDDSSIFSNTTMMADGGIAEEDRPTETPAVKMFQQMQAQRAAQPQAPQVDANAQYADYLKQTMGTPNQMQAPTAPPPTSTNLAESGYAYDPIKQQYGQIQGSAPADSDTDSENPFSIESRPVIGYTSTGEKIYGRGASDSTRVNFPGSVGGRAAGGSISDAAYNLGGYSDGGRLLRGPGDGVSDSIPAMIGKKQPARLADGEFVVPARIVSELGNGSTEAGARKLYAMMDRIQKARGKTVGKGKVAKNSRSEKYLPA